jgi:hypothetical protein
LRHNAFGHHAEQHLSIEALQALLVESVAGELMAVDNVGTARRANSADNSAPAAPDDSVFCRHERR